MCLCVCVCVYAWISERFQLFQLDPTGTLTANNGETTGFSERQVKARFIVMLTQSDAVFPTKSCMLSTRCWTHHAAVNKKTIFPSFLVWPSSTLLHYTNSNSREHQNQVFLMASHNSSFSSFRFLASRFLYSWGTQEQRLAFSLWWWITKSTSIFICVLNGEHPPNCKFFSLRGLRMRIQWNKLNSTFRVNKHEDSSKLCNVSLYDCALPF